MVLQVREKLAFLRERLVLQGNLDALPYSLLVSPESPSFSSKQSMFFFLYLSMNVSRCSQDSLFQVLSQALCGGYVSAMKYIAFAAYLPGTLLSSPPGQCCRHLASLDNFISSWVLVGTAV